MKWFKRNIGDELLLVGRLPALHRGIYWSLELYYKGDEVGLTADQQELAVMAGVNIRKKSEREALQAVLRRFFVLSADGSRHQRTEWDRAIANYQRGAPEEEAREEQRQGGNSERQRRLRVRKKLWRAALLDNGISTPENIGMGELRALCVQHLGQTVTDALADVEAGDEAETVTPPVTSPVTPVTPPLKPVTINHQPPSNPTHHGEATGGVGGGEGDGVTQTVTAAVTPLREASRSDAVRSVATDLSAQGLLVHHTDADLQKLVAAGWDAQAIQAQKPAAGWAAVSHPMAWLVGKLRKKVTADGALPAPEGGAAGGWPETRSGVEAIAARLGLAPWDQVAFCEQRGPSFKDWEDGVRQEAQRRGERVA
jgi:uncharacterized protein YdaU (DUF1376 family)